MTNKTTAELDRDHFTMMREERRDAREAVERAERQRRLDTIRSNALHAAIQAHTGGVQVTAERITETAAVFLRFLEGTQ